ncbi:protein NRT1/ PTR FAMILY 6.4 [Ricinus communis]|uniref:Oligopeptide transporter, putative n=1 Tax=Ricinus communis TaxID=3988 RepID=B9SH54_RICCO|nr:protein NRT1/ PTR FAMILY 6.4 [Ricinus communis]EEF37056.1 oligopeptide transporter, putative [Ricinus communis]|eukprot:XP_002525323.1 protein NRT1/ PTR FAMILY 6.4 [Ricinus communis]
MVLVTSSGDKVAMQHETAVDFHGNPVDKSKTGGWLAAGLILGTELSERICVMGISMNLVTYLVGDLHISSAKSATIVTNFMGTLNLLGLLGGFLADAKFGRYLTVAIFASITAVGVIMLTSATTISSMRPPPCDDYRRQHHQCIEANGQQLALLYAALYTIALGGGGIKSNVSGFGSDQFDATDPKEEKAMIFFFNRFYFCISIGSLFAVIVLVYVQDNVGRGWGYGISAGTMAIAVAILLCGTPWYRFKKPQGSPLTVIWRVFFLAWKKRGHPHPSHPSFLNDYQNSRVLHTEKFKCIDKAAIMDGDASADGNKNNPWIVSTVMEVEEVKMLLKLIPIWSTCILFWTAYSQMTTFTIEQATFMDRKVGSFTIPAGSMSTFLFITILLFTSLNERLFVPMARKLTNNSQGFTSLQRIGIGLIFSVVAMVAAALIEKERREFAVQYGTQISAFWLVPQYFLVGAGEAFAYVGQLEFFIREAPERMKSMSTGLFLSTLSMGFFVSSLLVSIVDKVTKKIWLRSNLNKGELDNFYWLLAALGSLNFFAFLAFAMRHQYKVLQYTKPFDSGEKELKTPNDLMVIEMEKEGPPV